MLDNPFNQRVNAIIQKTREMRRGPYWPHLYIVKEDGEPALRLWALSCLVQDRSDVLPSYQQFISQLKDKVRRGVSSEVYRRLMARAAGQWWQLLSAPGRTCPINYSRVRRAVLLYRWIGMICVLSGARDFTPSFVVQCRQPDVLPDIVEQWPRT